MAQRLPIFSRRFVIYIPVYNCAKTIAKVLAAIPEEFETIAEVLIVDNCSTDGTVEVIHEVLSEIPLRLPITVIRTSENRGYAGSQKLAYRLVRRCPGVEWVIMLHGDGQYEPDLMKKFLPYTSGTTAIVYGARSKRLFPRQEETPWLTWAIIKGLSLLESIATGYPRLEWHSGFVMYRTHFLRRVNLESITSTRHMDGHLLFAAGFLHEPVQNVRIYKRYLGLEAFEGAAKKRYVLHVIQLMFYGMRRTRHAIENPDTVPIEGSFTLLHEFGPSPLTVHRLP